MPPGVSRGNSGNDRAALREGGGTALAEIFSPLVCTPSRSRDGGSLRVMELYLEFYRVFIKIQSLYNPIFLQDLVLTISSLDYPMAPSPLRGAPSRREPRGTAGGASPSPTGTGGGYDLASGGEPREQRQRPCRPPGGRWHGSRGDFFSACLYPIAEP